MKKKREEIWIEDIFDEEGKWLLSCDLDERQ